MDLLPYCDDGSMIPVYLSANCEGRICDPNGSGIQILRIRSRDPFSGSTDMSASHFIEINLLLTVKKTLYQESKYKYKRKCGCNPIIDSAKETYAKNSASNSQKLPDKDHIILNGL